MPHLRARHTRSSVLCFLSTLLCLLSSVFCPLSPPAYSASDGAPAAKRQKDKAKKDGKGGNRVVAFPSRTSFPGTAKPDSITLTWTDEPSTTQTVRWRTSAAVATGTLAFARGETATFDPASAQKISAATHTLSTPTVLNDTKVNFHTATITGLEPGSRYTYAVGDGSATGWSEPATFTTAPVPGKPRPFSFIYIGDTQGARAAWGDMMRGALQKRPDAAFIVIAGDLVNRGLERDDYDNFFSLAKGVFNTRAVAPAAGNHDYQGGGPRIFQNFFALRENGPKNIGPGLAYSFEYSDALVIVLDSNRDIAGQAAWLEQQLRDTKATWKFVVYHHPAYNSSAGRSTPDIRRHWLPLFDKYHVDLALQGHDHGYLRTWPMRANKRVATPADGTVYIVSYSCPKSYDLGKFDYTEVGFADVPTWQLIEVDPETRVLRYRAHDAAGKVRDEFSIKK